MYDLGIPDGSHLNSKDTQWLQQVLCGKVELFLLWLTAPISAGFRSFSVAFRQGWHTCMGIWFLIVFRVYQGLYFEKVSEAGDLVKCPLVILACNLFEDFKDPDPNQRWL